MLGVRLHGPPPSSEAALVVFGVYGGDWSAVLEPKVFSGNFERFPKSSIYPSDSKAVLVTRSGSVIHYGLLGVRLYEPPLKRGGFFLPAGRFRVRFGKFGGNSCAAHDHAFAPACL